MITKKTVLVLGAGASVPYGFPSGAELVARICTDLREGQIRDKIDEIIYEDHFDTNFDDFLNTLEKSGQMSIDAFLEHNEQYLDYGKLAIAAILLPLEDEKKLFSFGETNWYKLLFNQLNTEFEAFADNELSIISFNYDRSLEHFLVTALNNSYPDPNYSDCFKKMSDLPVIHLHGTLGPYPKNDLRAIKNEKQYDPQFSKTSLRKCIKQIRIIHEEVEADPAFKTAKKLLSEAEIVAFLGFGYDAINLKRLDLRSLSLYRQDHTFYGTTYNLGNAEKNRVSNYFYGNIKLIDCRVEDMLKDQPILIQPSSIRGARI